MPKWKLKGCPRCQGDLVWEDRAEVCLQCGYRRELKVTFQSPQTEAEEALKEEKSWLELLAAQTEMQQTR